MALPKHLQDIVDSPRAQKIYKEAQHKSGLKHGYIKKAKSEALKSRINPKEKSAIKALTKHFSK